MKYFISILFFISNIIIYLIAPNAYAKNPAVTIVPQTPTRISVPANSTAIIKYLITNQTQKSQVLQLRPIKGISQITTGAGVCGERFALPGKGVSCSLWLKVLGNELTKPVKAGPLICKNRNSHHCFHPDSANVLHVTQGPPITTAGITVTGSPFNLIQNGPPATVTVTNNSQDIAATNIASNFRGTALNGHVSESGNTCQSIPVNGTCTLTFTPNNAIVPLTNFTIAGTNTNSVNVAMAINAATPVISALSPTTGQTTGGTTVTLTGSYFTDATAVTFDGIEGTNLIVLNDTTATVVSPAHAAGSVDVVITTPGGSMKLSHGYTYNASPTLSTITPISGPTSGGSGITISGTNLTGVTSVSIGGKPATYVNVLNATTLTAVSPANTLGNKDVVVTSAQGSGTLTNGFSYEAPAIGQLSSGGYIGCLGGPTIYKLIVATSDISPGIMWGYFGAIGTNSSNGLISTNSIYNFMTKQGLDPNTYAAGLCHNYEVDSQGNTPCQAGNECYKDWFLPARYQLSCICTSTNNHVPSLGFDWSKLYWSSSQIDDYNIYGYSVVGGVCSENGDNNPSIYPVRCARFFTP